MAMLAYDVVDRLLSLHGNYILTVRDETGCVREVADVLPRQEGHGTMGMEIVTRPIAVAPLHIECSQCEYHPDNRRRGRR